MELLDQVLVFLNRTDNQEHTQKPHSHFWVRFSSGKERDIRAPLQKTELNISYLTCNLTEVLGKETSVFGKINQTSAFCLRTFWQTVNQST